MPGDKKRSLQARDKPAALGPDLYLGSYSRNPPEWSNCPLSNLSEDITRRALHVGVVPNQEERAATYFQIDHSVVFRAVQRMFEGRIEVLSTGEALKKYEWLKDYWWNLIEVDTDKYTALTELNWDQGYFIRVLERQRVTVPIQSCLFTSTNNLNQNVHNIIIAEPSSEVHIITGCTVHSDVNMGLHVGVSEFYIKKNAKLTFTMVHDWAQNFDVRPRTAVLIEDNATFINNYLCLKPVKSLQMYPVAYCKGVNSRVRFNSIIYGSSTSLIDVGSKVVLQNDGSRGEVIARAVAKDNAEIFARGLLVGEHGNTKAHLECRGLILSDNALIHSVPELLAKTSGTDFPMRLP